MPLKLRKFDDPSVLNKWADGIEQAINTLKTPVPLKSPLPVFKTQGVINTSQKVLNLVAGDNIELSSDTFGDTVISGTGGASDGITHGRLPWEGDPSLIVLQDDFLNNINGSDSSSISATGIGQLGWSLVGSPSSEGGFFGGRTPYVGQIAWGNGGSASGAGWLKLPSTGNLASSQYAQNCMALGEGADTTLSYVFKIEGDYINQQFSTAQKALYIGLMGTTVASTFVATPVSRPDVFIGLRYDTSTSGSGLNDSFYTLEVTANKTFTSPARNNSQGTTLVTSVSPVQGVWHRLDIYFNAVGMVTITLDGTTSLTAPVPTISFTTTVTGAVTQHVGLINWTASGTVPVNPWGSGSAVLVSGFGGAQAVLNGTQSLTIAGGAVGYFDFPTASIGAGSASVTLSGFPSLTPVFMLGNDDTAGPTSNTMLLFVDYWSMVSNPNLGPNAPGVASIINPRYF